MVEIRTRILGIAPYDGMRTAMENAAQAYPNVLLDVQTGDLADQTVHQVVGRDHFQRLFADDGETSREVFLFLRTVTDHDNFIQRFRIFQ